MFNCRYCALILVLCCLHIGCKTKREPKADPEPPASSPPNSPPSTPIPALPAIPVVAKPEIKQKPISSVLADRKVLFLKELPREAGNVESECFLLLESSDKINAEKALSTYWENEASKVKAKKAAWKANLASLTRDDQQRLTQISSNLDALEQGSMEPAHPIMGLAKGKGKAKQIGTGPGGALTEDDLNFVKRKSSGMLDDQIRRAKRKLAGLPPEPTVQQISKLLKERLLSIANQHAETSAAKIKKAYISDREMGFSDMQSTVTTQDALAQKSGQGVSYADIGPIMGRHLEESRLRCVSKAKDAAQKIADEWSIPASVVDREAKEASKT